MFVYQKTIIYPLALACPEDTFFGLLRDQQTQWLVDNCRLALKYATDGTGEAQWPQNFAEEFKKYLLEQAAKPKAGKAMAKKSMQEKLLCYAKSLKNKLPAAVFQAKNFDPSLTEKAREKVTKEMTEEEVNAMRRPWVRQEQVHLNGLCILDIDHLDNARALYESWKQQMDFWEEGIVLIYLTPSLGLRVVFKARMEWGNLIDNQLHMAALLGVKADESCKDASRRAFLTTENDLLFINKEIFSYENKEFAKTWDAEYRAGHSGATQNHDDAPQNGGQGPEPDGHVDNQTVVEPTLWRGLDMQAVIDARYSGDARPCSKNSNRHAESLKLATDLLMMLDGDKRLVERIVRAQPWVQEIISERDENVTQTVESAAKQLAKREGETSNPYPSKPMMKAVETVAGKPFRAVLNGTAETFEEETEAQRTPGDMTAQLEGWGEEIEALFDDFPLLRDVCAGLKRSQYPAALFVAGGTLMTLMTRTWYRFYHRPQQERRLNCSLFIIGHPASNKSLADDIYEVLSAPIAAADQAGKQALNSYKQDLKKKAANKEGKDKPQGIIRIHPARTSNGQLIQDMLNARENIEGKEIQLHMLTFDTELDNSTTLQQGGSWINKMSMELKAFHNEKDGQMYQNSDSPVDEFNVTWNFIYTGTPIALKRKVNERNFGSGLSTRLAVIPVPKTNCEMMDFEEKEEVDWQRLERMKNWAYKLDSRFGELPLWGLVRKIYDWTKDRMEDCKEDRSEANELMLKRVPYHALNYSAPFIDMRHWQSLHQKGSYWTGDYETDETDWRLCELIARMQYATQQHFFGVLAEKYFDDMNSDVQIMGKRHQRKSVEGYNKLPEVFDKDDVMRAFGYDKESAAYKKIERLAAMNFITKIRDGADAGKYRKTSASIN